MSLFSTIASISLRGHADRVAMYSQYPDETQFQLFGDLLHKAAKTDFGRRYGFLEILKVGPSAFADTVPLCRWDDVADILLDPQQNRMLADCNELSAKDLVAAYLALNPKSGILSGRILLMGGDDYFGRIPFWLMGACVYGSESAENKDVTCICGYPSLILQYMRLVLQKTGKSRISDVWPNLELIIGGGMDMAMYIPVFDDIIGGGVSYISTLGGPYGFLGYQVPEINEGYSLMLDNGIYYEFVPEEELNNADCKAVPLCEVRTGVRYAMVTSGCGLWRYISGHIVEFGSLRPYRFDIVDNIYMISNAFGERISRQQAQKAIRLACMKTGAEVRDYSVEPVLLDSATVGRLIWNVDFASLPNDTDSFVATLDFELKRVNEAYNALRYKGVIDTLKINIK